MNTYKGLVNDFSLMSINDLSAKNKKDGHRLMINTRKLQS